MPSCRNLSAKYSADRECPNGQPISPKCRMVSNQMTDQNERADEQYGECNCYQIEILVDKRLDRAAEFPYQPTYGEETQTSRHNRCDNEHCKIDVEQTARNGEEFVGQRRETCRKDNPEIIASLGEIDEAKLDALTSYVGMDGITFYDINTKKCTMKSGDYLLLTSDGLYKGVEDNVIADIIGKNTSLKDIGNELLEQAKVNCKGNQDNTSFIIIRYI